MQYTTDLTNVYAHLSEDCVRSVWESPSEFNYGHSL